MRILFEYLLLYIKDLSKKDFLFISLFTAFLVFCNYAFHLEQRLIKHPHRLLSFTGFFFLYLLAFGGAYLMLSKGGAYLMLSKKKSRSQEIDTKKNLLFFLIILAAPAIYAWRMSSGIISAAFTSIMAEPWSKYWAIILNAPLKCALMMMAIGWINKYGRYEKSILGLSPNMLPVRPFLLGLLLFFPVILIASNQPDFQAAYPKAHRISFIYEYARFPWLTTVLFEISYAFDFLIVEVFFRGFLVLAMVRYAGAAAILPMAVFYCAIHFGKPLAECISSFFGGILLGVFSYRSNSIMGGFILHLGIGWLMELVGFFQK